MTNLAEKEQLARIVLEAADALACFETQAGPRRVSGIWAVVPVKEFEGAKQRLSSALSPEERRALATTMLEDVLDAVSAVRELAGVLVVTLDPAATSLASRYRRARRHRRRAGWPHRRRHRRRAPARARGAGGHDDDARRYSAPVVRGDRRHACRAPRRAFLHDRARA